MQKIEDLHGEVLAEVIQKGIAIKANIVKQDERENGVRGFLNFGHTLGHAIEANVGYGKITHGEGVVIGMIFALKISMDRMGLSFDIESFEAWLEQLGYELALPACDHLHLLASMKKDKKTTGQTTTFIVLSKVGEPTTIQLSDDEVLQYLQKYFG